MIDKKYRQFYENLFSQKLKKAARGFFDEAALPSYTHPNRLMSFLFWDRLNKAFSLTGDLNGKKVLDFGAGGGVTFRYLSDAGAEIYACENQFYELTQIVAHELKIKVPVYKDIMDIEDVKFDLILALDVLEHVDNLEEVLTRFIELSHKNTRFIISGPTENLLYKLGRKMAGFKGHYHLRNVYHIERMLRQKGFQQKGVKKLYFPVTLFRVSLWTLK